MLSALLALPASAQKITTQHEVVDCGQVVFHKPVTAEFVLKNDGHKPLVRCRLGEYGAGKVGGAVDQNDTDRREDAVCVEPDHAGFGRRVHWDNSTFERA